MTTITIPEQNQQLLEKISRDYDIALAVLEEEYINTFTSPTADRGLKIGIFEDDDAVHGWARSEFIAGYMNREPTKPFGIIPVGCDGPKVSKANQMYGTLFFFLVSDDSNLDFKYARLNGKETEIVLSDVDWFKFYPAAHLMTYMDSKDKSTQYKADKRLKMTEGEDPGYEPRQLLEAVGEAVKFDEVDQNLSKVIGDWADRMDWKRIRGTIYSIREFQNSETGLSVFFYDLIDIGSTGNGGTVSEDGRFRPDTLNITTSATFATHLEQDVVEFAGVLRTKPESTNKETGVVYPEKTVMDSYSSVLLLSKI